MHEDVLEKKVCKALSLMGFGVVYENFANFSLHEKVGQKGNKV